MRLGLKVGQKGRRKPKADGQWTRLQCGQHAVVEAAAIAQPIAPGRVADAGHEQQRRHNHFGVFRLGDAIGVFFHRAARVPGMKGHGFVHLVHHWQSDPAWLRLVDQFAVFLPAVQCRQRIELALDRPIGADHGIRTPHQPDAHDTLQKVGAL